jgi:glycosyltransferase involved in cell wall biosynthesis/lauroyl/myristoyl acyltransferase
VAFTITEVDEVDHASGSQDALLAPAPTARKFALAGEIARRLMFTMVVWALYVPHLAILKLLGPRLGPRWARTVGRLHWLLTFVGAQQAVRTAFERMYTNFRTDLSLRTVLRKHLELKHECFARTKLFNSQQLTGANDGIAWEVEPAIASGVQQIRASGQGLIIVGFHFGFFRLSATQLSQIFPGCDAVHLSHRIAHYEHETMGRVAQMALERALMADERSGARMHYIENDSSMVRIYRLLVDGEAVAVAADGAFAKDFMDVPFFDGKLRLPCGWARLAAATRSHVLFLADSQIDCRRRKVRLFECAPAVDESPNGIRRAVSQAAQVLQELIREEPWSWHPWQRLQFETADDGTPLWVIAELGRENRPKQERIRDSRLAPVTYRAARSASGKAIADPTAFASYRNGGTTMHHYEGTSTRRRIGGDSRSGARRVAIVANSFTPYRIYVHQRIVRDVPEVELWTLMTHGNSYNRWQGLEPPEEIRPLNFGHGEPTIEQTKLRFALREWRKFGRIIRWIEEHQIEAVICQGFGDVGRLRLVRWCRRRGIPCFLTADCNIWGDVRPGPKRALKHLVVGQAIRWSSGVMPCGEYGRLLFERYGATRDKTFMFPLISNLELFGHAPSEALRQVQQEYGLDSARRRMLYCGRMMQVKRPDLTVSAFVALADERPDWDLVFVGGGALREATAASVPPRLRERVKWLGLVHDTTRLASIFALCDVLVLPSDKEPWGMVLIEAAAAGLALVTTDIVGASPELVSDGENGRVFRPGDLNAFIDALRDVTQPDRIDETKANSRRVLARWMAQSDPVAGFRAAMQSCGLIPRQPQPAAPIVAAGPIPPVMQEADKVAIEA